MNHHRAADLGCTPFVRQRVKALARLREKQFLSSTEPLTIGAVGEAEPRTAALIGLPISSVIGRAKRLLFVFENLSGALERKHLELSRL